MASNLKQTARSLAASGRRVGEQGGAERIADAICPTSARVRPVGGGTLHARVEERATGGGGALLLLAVRGAGGGEPVSHQHEPQYWGMCWFSSFVVYDRPLTADQSKSEGSCDSSMSSDGIGVVMTAAMSTSYERSTSLMRLCIVIPCIAISDGGGVSTSTASAEAAAIDRTEAFIIVEQSLDCKEYDFEVDKYRDDEALQTEEKPTHTHAAETVTRNHVVVLLPPPGGGPLPPCLVGNILFSDCSLDLIVTYHE